MHGYGYPPEQPPKRRPSSATLNTLRVLFVTLTVLSCGLLAWGSMLRLAIVTRARRDWAALVLVFVLNVGLFAFILATPDDPDKMTDAEALIGIGWLGGVMIGSIAYYLYADIRHFGPFGPFGANGPYGGGMPGSPAQYGGYLPPQARAVTPGYGYPPVVPQPPASRSPQPQPPMPRTPVPQTPASQTPLPRTPVPTPPPPATAPAPTPPPASSAAPTAHPRLDQVRAELDELSDYLRKEGGNR